MKVKTVKAAWNGDDICDPDGNIFWGQADWKAAPERVLEKVNELLITTGTGFCVVIGEGDDDQVYFNIVKQNKVVKKSRYILLWADKGWYQKDPTGWTKDRSLAVKLDSRAEAILHIQKMENKGLWTPNSVVTVLY